MAVGQEIVCLCTSCKLELRHVIVAHKSGNSGPIAKVRCNTCAKIHSYRATPQEGVARKERAVREKVQVIPIAVEWSEHMKAQEGKPSTAYAPLKDFKVGDVIDHPQFGAGVVRHLKEGNKLEVLFQMDVKILVHRMKEF